MKWLKKISEFFRAWRMDCPENRWLANTVYRSLVFIDYEVNEVAYADMLKIVKEIGLYHSIFRYYCVATWDNERMCLKFTVSRNRIISIETSQVKDQCIVKMFTLGGNTEPVEYVVSLRNASEYVYNLIGESAL